MTTLFEQPDLDTADADQWSAEALFAELAELDVEMAAPRSEAERDLARIHRRRQELASEVARCAAVVDQARAMLKAAESAVANFDYVTGPRARELTAELLATTKAKGKSFKTAFGTSGFRMGRAGINVLDEETVIKLVEAEKLPAELIVVKRSVSKTEAMKHIQATGEDIDGVEIVPAAESFYTK